MLCVHIDLVRMIQNDQLANTLVFLTCFCYTVDYSTLLTAYSPVTE